MNEELEQLLRENAGGVNRQNYFVIAENAFINNPKYTTTEKMVFLSLCTYAGKKQSCFPGQTGIAENLGLSRRTVVSTIQSLKEKGGLLVLNQYTETNRNTVNTYFLADIDSKTGEFITSSLDMYRQLTGKAIRIKGK